MVILAHVSYTDKKGTSLILEHGAAFNYAHTLRTITHCEPRFLSGLYPMGRCMSRHPKAQHITRPCLGFNHVIILFLSARLIFYFGSRCEQVGEQRLFYLDGLIPRREAKREGGCGQDQLRSALCWGSTENRAFVSCAPSQKKSLHLTGLRKSLVTKAHKKRHKKATRWQMDRVWQWMGLSVLKLF